MTWNDGKLRGFCDGILAKEKSEVQLNIFKRVFKIADDEVLARCSLGKNQNQDSCDGLKSINPATLLTSPPMNKDDSQTTLPYCSSDNDSDQFFRPPEEYYTVYCDDCLDETHEEDLIRRLNVMKDNPQTQVNLKRMKQITFTLRDAEKRGKIKSRGGHDHLDEMYVPARKNHWINGTGKKIIDTGKLCIGIRPSIQHILEYIQSTGGIRAPVVILGDVPKAYFIHRRIPPLSENGQWIVSTEGDCIFACKKWNNLV